MSAVTVAKPERILRARDPAASSSRTIGCRQRYHAMSAATATATMAATALEPISPMLAENAKIPKAHASESVVSVRAVSTGWVI
jgi:hypothetical protein